MGNSESTAPGRDTLSSVASQTTYSAPSSTQSNRNSTSPVDFQTNSAWSARILTPEFGFIGWDIRVPYVHPDCLPQGIGEDGREASDGAFLRLHPDKCLCLNKDQFTSNFGYQLVTLTSGDDHLMFGAWFVRVSRVRDGQDDSRFCLEAWPATMGQLPNYERLLNTYNSFKMTMRRSGGGFTSDLKSLGDRLVGNKAINRFTNQTGDRYQEQGYRTPFAASRFQRMLTVAFFNTKGAEENKGEC